MHFLKESVFISKKTTTLAFLFLPVNTDSFSFEHASFLICFHVSSTLKKGLKMLMEMTHDAFFVTIFKSLRHFQDDEVLECFTFETIFISIFRCFSKDDRQKHIKKVWKHISVIRALGGWLCTFPKVNKAYNPWFKLFNIFRTFTARQQCKCIAS